MLIKAAYICDSSKKVWYCIYSDNIAADIDQFSVGCRPRLKMLIERGITEAAEHNWSCVYDAAGDYIKAVRNREGPITLIHPDICKCFDVSTPKEFFDKFMEDKKKMVAVRRVM